MAGLPKRRRHTEVGPLEVLSKREKVLYGWGEVCFQTVVEATCSEHSRDHLRYGSDLTDGEWEIIAPLRPSSGKTSRPRRGPMREIMNAIF
jgi:hypothetical protein